MAITLRNPDAPATKRQLFTLEQMTGKDYSQAKLTMQKASDMIEKLQLDRISRQQSEIEIDETDPFAEPHVIIVNGSQRSGKTTYAVGKVVDAYFMDCVKIFCRDYLNLDCEVKSYDKINRIAEIIIDGEKKSLRIPESHKLNSPMRIFSNIHLYGIPYVYIPSFLHMAKWLKDGFIFNGKLIMDEAHIGISARSGMTTLGKELVAQCFQFGKSKLDVFLITHLPQLIDWTFRTVPTQRVTCEYNKEKQEVTFLLQKKGKPGTTEHTFDATQYWRYYKTNEKVRQ